MSQQSTLLLNGQRPIDASQTNIAKFYKTGDQICELNYWGTKCEIRDKVRDEKYNFANNV